MIALKNDIEEFVFTNAIEVTTAYSDVIEYDVADEARYENYVYKSIQDENTGNNPIDKLLESWIEWSPANDYAMLDYFRETITLFPNDEDGVIIFERGTKDTLLIGQFNAEDITIEYLNDSNIVIDSEDTETYEFNAYMNMYDPYYYIYGGFEYDTTQIIYQTIKRVGTRVRVTFSRTLHNNECGFLFAGNSIDFGRTLNSVGINSIEYENKTSRQVSFNTTMNKTALMYNLEKAKVNSESALAFIIDPTENTSHNNIVVIGKITDNSGVAENNELNQMSFTIEQNIRK